MASPPTSRRSGIGRDGDPPRRAEPARPAAGPAASATPPPASKAPSGGNGPTVPSRQDLGHRLMLMALAILLAASAIAVGFYPVVASAGKAVKRFDDQFLGLSTGPYHVPTFPVRSTIYAADGSILATPFLAENRRITALRNIPYITRRAVLAIEDHGFYQHGPINVSSIIRAALANLSAGKAVQGGSTISQQLVKNLEVGSAPTLARKIEEARLAIRLERTYSKDQIFELYLNEVYLGNGVYGVGTAAEYYFDRHAMDLNLAQSALLAGLIAAPQTWNPLTHPSAALARRNQVLGRMQDLGWIGANEYARAINAQLGVVDDPRNAADLGPEAHWVKYVENEILHNDPAFKKLFGKDYTERRDALFKGGLRIYTTIQPTMQQEARDAIANWLPDPGLEPPADPEAALVSIDPATGAIQAMAQSTSFKQSQVDLASQGHRQTGSAFKAFTLAAAMEEGVPPGRVYDSASPLTLPTSDCPPDGWHVSNAEPGTGGYMNLWDATKDSVNVVFAQLIRDVGADRVAQMAERMGIEGHVPGICALTLGAFEVSPLEMTTAYSTLANRGVHCEPYAIARIDSVDGKVLYRAQPKCQQVIPEEVANQVTAMLERVVQGGTGSAANIGRPQAGKTGTNQAFRDAWFMGYVPQLTTGVWVGYATGQIEMTDVRGIEVFGGTYPARIWHDFMSAAVAGLPVESFPPPPQEKGGTVPTVVGMLQDAAEQALAEANFTAVATEVDSSEPAGTVVAQSPDGGTTATLGTAVNLSVSNGKGPPVVNVPNVVGESMQQARQDLEAAGFKVKVEHRDVTDPLQDGVVVDQNPAGDSEAPKGSTVVIVVGRLGPGPSPGPTVSAPTGG